MKFSIHDNIRLQSKLSDKRLQGKITNISDSSLTLNYATEVMIRDIQKVYTHRWGFRMLQRLSIISGVMYLIISATNSAVNSDGTLISQETLTISGCLIIGGVLLTPLVTRTHDISKGKWKIKLLDFSP